MTFNRLVSFFLTDEFSLGVFHEYVKWSGVILIDFLLIQKFTSEIKNMEEVIEMDLFMKSVMLIMVLMDVLISIRAISMTLLLTLDCCLPDPVENEFAFTDANLSSLD